MLNQDTLQQAVALGDHTICLEIEESATHVHNSDYTGNFGIQIKIKPWIGACALG